MLTRLDENLYLKLSYIQIINFLKYKLFLYFLNQDFLAASSI